jgi:MHS family proline/betaine transporter-like MFS transporter
MPETAGVPLRGSQPMVGTEQEAKELISTSRTLQTYSEQEGPEAAKGSPSAP